MVHSRPLELENDGDLIALARRMIDHMGEGTVCISKVMGHADVDIVRQGQVRGLDRNNRGDEACDGGSTLGLLMLVVTSLECVGAGISPVVKV